MNLFTASQQWATRPNDERFWNLQEMFAACNGYRATSQVSEYNLKELTVDAKVLHEGSQPEMLLVSPKGGGAIMSHYAFGQLCTRVSAPASYLRTLPAGVSGALINFGINQAAADDKKAVVLHHQANGNRVARCITSDKYARIWNDDVCKWAMNLGNGWQVPPARPMNCDASRIRIATEQDVLTAGQFGLSVQVGQEIGPAGLYASDHDMFVFMVNQTVAIEQGKETLFRGFFISNSEVGDKRLKLTMFLYNHVCGNHICWGTRDVTEFSVVHIGDQAYSRYRVAQGKIMSAIQADTSKDREFIRLAQNFSLGMKKEEVVELVQKRTDLNGKQAESAWELAEQHADVHGDPRSAWGYTQGVTRLSQLSQYQDARDKLDRTGRQILEMAF
jgi:hypothetical protein